MATNMNARAVCGHVLERVKALGGKAIVTLSANHEVKCVARAGKIEQLAESQSGRLDVALYVDGRYASHGTNDLGEGALERFLAGAIAATRLLDPDADRQLPDIALFAGRAEQLSGVIDGDRGKRTLAERKAEALQLGAEARNNAGPLFVSAEAVVSDVEQLTAKATSNGFYDEQIETGFEHGVSVSLKDGEKRPEDGLYLSARRRRSLPPGLGKAAAERALGRVGQKKTVGGERLVLIENQIVPRLLGFFLRAMSGQALFQKRSFLEGKLGQPVMSHLVNLVDDPLLAAGLGSRRFDGEGLTARRRPLVEEGVLRSYNLDTYYARKLKLAPTSGSFSNLVMKPGERSREAIEKERRSLIVVNHVIGGNSNSLTGDFSVGVGGYVVEDEKKRPFAEMNLTGNHLTFWQRVVEVADDPWIYSSARTPSVLIDKVAIA